jgi:hypothetical protein
MWCEVDWCWRKQKIQRPNATETFLLAERCRRMASPGSSIRGTAADETKTGRGRQPPHTTRSDPPPPSFHSDRKQTRTAQCSSHKSPPRTHMPSARCSITATTRHAQEEMVRRQTAIRVGQSIRMSASSSSCSTTNRTKHRKSSLPDCYYLNKSLTTGSLQLDFRG